MFAILLPFASAVALAAVPVVLNLPANASVSPEILLCAIAAELEIFAFVINAGVTFPDEFTTITSFALFVPWAVATRAFTWAVVA